MKNYIIPTLELQPAAITLNCGTNDLRQTVSPEVVTREIFTLGTEKNVIIISGIISRKDQYRDKARDNNEF